MDFEYIIKNDEVTITGYKDESVTSLIIPEYIEGLLVTKIGNLAFYRCFKLREVFTPNSIVDINANSFINCTSLKSINNILICNDFCTINDRFILHNTVIYKIMYQVGVDYYCESNNCSRYFIGSDKFYYNFKVN